MKHTETLWKIDKPTRSNWPGRGYSQDITTDVDAPVIVHGDTEEYCTHRAAYIVRCVNAHQQLVSALEACEKHLHETVVCAPGNVREKFSGLLLHQQVKAALSAAKAS